MTAPDRMSGNVWKVFVNTDLPESIVKVTLCGSSRLMTMTLVDLTDDQ